jgi:hypothetical protein
MYRRNQNLYGTLVCLLALLMLGCQTPQRLAVSEIPSSMLPLFGKCANPEDGGGEITYSLNKKLISGIRLDWVQSSDAFIGELSDPVGSTFIRWNESKENQKIFFSGYAAPSTDLVSVDKNGFLNYDSYLVGVKSKEIPCFLSFKIPYSWTENLIGKRLYRQKSDGRVGKIELEFNDGNRVMWVSYYPKISKTCSRIKWSNYWGLSTTMWNICYYTRKEPWKTVFEFSASDYIEMVAE